MFEFNRYFDGDECICGTSPADVEIIINGIRFPLCGECVKELTEALREFNKTVLCYRCKHFAIHDSGLRYGGKCSLTGNDVSHNNTCFKADRRDVKQ